VIKVIQSIIAAAVVLVLALIPNPLKDALVGLVKALTEFIGRLP